MKQVVIVGAQGQDGTLLAQLLQQRSVFHCGIGRKGILDASGKIIGSLDLTDAGAVAEFVQTQRPSHVFYLAAHHHSSQDRLDENQEALWKASLDVQVSGLVHFLEALRLHAPAAKLFYASSSHVFGAPTQFPQDENTPLAPDNVYAITKVAGHHACRHYRNHHDLFASVGILYNHESIHRRDNFLSKKIIRGALAIKKGEQQTLALGDLSAQADWGYAPDYVDAMVRILDLPQSDVYVVATGQLHTVREFVRIVFDELGLDDAKHVIENPALIRQNKNPTRLAGDHGRLEKATGWKPTLSFEEMVRTITRQMRNTDKA